MTSDGREIDLLRFAADIVLRNGSTLRLRPVAPADAPKILEFLLRLSAASLQFRFWGARRPDERLAVEMAVSDPAATFGLAGELGGAIVAIAHYYRLGAGDPRAEVAFAIADGMQGLGVGTRLLERLADVGREHGIRSFQAEVLPANFAMSQVFLDSGFEVRESRDGEQFHFEMRIDPTDAYEARAAERSQKAASASMKPLFEPRSIAVVGAGRRRGRLGAELFRNLLAGGFAGPVHPVHKFTCEV
jgi:GNAT superfamily N-acetyltransferase